MATKKANVEAIKNAAAASTEPVKLDPVAEAVAISTVPDTAYTFGFAAPEYVVESLEKDRLTRVPLEFLSVKRGFNVRDFTAAENIAHVAQLKENIMLNGWLPGTALTVFTETDVEDPTQTRIVVWRGESRTRALLEIVAEKGPGVFSEVPVILVDLPSSADVAADFELSNSGKNLTLLEQYEVVQRLMAEGFTRPSELGRKMGISHTAVNNIKLAGYATPKMREWIKEGWIAATVVVEMVRKLELSTKEPDEQAVLLGELEKSVSNRVTRAKNLAKGAGSHNQDEEAEPKEQKPKNPDDAAFSKVVYLQLLNMHRELLNRILLPASEYSEARAAIKGMLDSNNLPSVAPVVEAAKKAKAKAEEAAEVTAAA